jgi:hypothetical protein
MEPEPDIKPQFSNVLRKSESLPMKIPVLTYNHGSQFFRENPNEYLPTYKV